MSETLARLISKVVEFITMRNDIVTPRVHARDDHDQGPLGAVG
jgi:hypothetical protein